MINPGRSCHGVYFNLDKARRVIFRDNAPWFSWCKTSPLEERFSVRCLSWHNASTTFGFLVITGRERNEHFGDIDWTFTIWSSGIPLCLSMCYCIQMRITLALRLCKCLPIALLWQRIIVDHYCGAILAQLPVCYADDCSVADCNPQWFPHTF